MRPSRIQGNGLFAAQPFGADEVVVRVGGVVMSDAEFRAFAAAQPRYNALQLDEDLHLVEQPETTARTEGSLNHSCDSNLWMCDARTLCTRWAIERDEELTVDYALFSGGDEALIDGPCRCGSRVCRGAARGTDWRIGELQERYRGHFSPFIERRIARASGA